MLSSPSTQRETEPVERMKASVIIPTHNRKEILYHVLQYYCQQDHPKENFELIIIDDGSTDNTPALFARLTRVDIDHTTNHLLKRHARRILSASEGFYISKTGDLETTKIRASGEPVYVKFIQTVKSGRSIARNIGLSVATYPLIIFADDDIFVEPAFVRKHVECHASGDNTVIMGTVIHTRDFKNPLTTRWKLKDINTAFLSTGNASVLKEHLLRAGGFDEGYSVYGWEDFDIGIHLEKNGLESVKKKIYGYHYDPPHPFIGPQSIYNKEKERGFSAVYFFKNHPLRWVRRFTLVNNRVLQGVVQALGYRNWFLSKEKIFFFKGLLKLLIRYKGYFDGIEEGKEHLKIN